MTKQLRPYQTDTINAIESAYKKGVKEQLLVLPCGTGKTFTCVKSIKGKGRVNFIVSTEELVEQGGIALLAELELLSYTELIDIIGNCGGLINLIKSKPKGTEIIYNHIGLIKADIFDIEKPIVISSAQTLHNRLELIPKDHFKVIVCDEADLFLSKTFREPLTYFSYDLLLGLTATPYRQDNLPLDDIFGEIVYEYEMKDAVKDGNLTKPIVVKLKTTANLDDVHTLAGEFNTKELTQKVNTPQRNYQIVDGYIKHGEGRQFIAFCVDVAHAIDLCEAFNEKGVKCGYIVGDKKLTPDRRNVLNSFHNGELTGLTNCMILSVGYDYSDIGVGIMAAPTKSKRKFIQQLGRVMRLKSPEFVKKWAQTAIILDIVDGTKKHRLINTDELDRDLDLDSKIFLSDEHRQKLIDAKEKRERVMEVQNREQDEIFELFPIPKVPRFKRSDKPATEPQLKLIKHLGYDIENEFYTYNMIQDILLSQPAAKQDFDNITGAGYDTSRGLSIVEAKLAYSDIIERDKRKKLKK